jgi:Wadjet anti plasmid transformation system JetA-like protein
MEFSFTPSPDVTVLLNALLDILERRHSLNPILRKLHQDAVSEVEGTEHATRSIKITLADISLPHYFSQANPEPRLIANEQLIKLEKNGLLQLTWIPGGTGHLLQSIAIPKTKQGTSNAELFHLLSRTPQADNRSRLESLLLADKFRFQDDWRARAILFILNQLKVKKTPAPFNLIDSNLNSDLLAALQAVPTLLAETPFRVFSVRVFNDSKRFEAIKSQFVMLARIGNPEWRRIPAEEVLRELSLVANPSYIHLSGNWQFTTDNGEILNLSGFTPSIGFPAAQTSTLQSVRAESVLCIENLTTFHQYIRQREQGDRYTGKHASTNNGICNPQHSLICTYGNPSPAIRRVLRLLPKTTPIFLWSDLDYGGFNILSQLRRTVNEQIQPFLMDIETLESNTPCARPLTASDRTNLKHLLLNANLRDVRSIIEHLLRRGLKLEQEGVENF